jgi:hypothetical protein
MNILALEDRSLVSVYPEGALGRSEHYVLLA